MNKRDCNIVFDLLPNYIENDVTADTKEFIESHLKECKNCRKILEDIKNDDIDNQLKNDKNYEIEIEKIKKVKRNFKMHKMILIISSIIASIVAIVLVFNAINNRTKKTDKTLYDSITETFEVNKNLDNCRFIEEYTYIVYNTQGSFSFTDTVNYKDGKFKSTENVEFKDNGNRTTKITYGKTDSNEVTQINDNITKNNVIDSQYSGKKRMFDGYFGDMRIFKDLDYEEIEIKNIDGKEWYYYKYGNDEKYAEYWLDKENLTDLKYIEVDPKYYRECLYTIEKDVVTDEDIKIEYDGFNSDNL